jgi:selenocysteine lyase/cysteine desulfurase
MAVINEIGSERIRAWTAELSQYLIDEGRRRGFTLHGIDDAQRKSPSTAFVCSGDAHRIEAKLKERHILASARGPVIRLAPHFFSTYDDCTIALDALEEVFAEAPRGE